METAQLNAEIPKQLKKDLELHCVNKDVTQKEVVEMALQQFLKAKPKMKK